MLLHVLVGVCLSAHAWAADGPPDAVPAAPPPPIVGGDPTTHWPARKPYIVAYPLLVRLNPGTAEDHVLSARTLASRMAAGHTDLSIVLTADPASRWDADTRDRAEGRFHHAAKLQFNAGELAYDLRRAITSTRTVQDPEAFLAQLRPAVEGLFAQIHPETHATPKVLHLLRAATSEQQLTTAPDREWPRHR